MKSVVADYRYRVLCMKIVPVVGSTIYLTDHVTDMIMSGHTYISTSGYQFTGYSAGSDFSPATIDIEGIAGVAGISRAAISSGVFDGARCYVFATDWTSPTEDEEQITAGVFGKATMMDDRYTITGVSLIDALNQSVGDTYGAQCPKKFGGTEYAGCGVSLATYTVTGTLTAVSNAQIFTDTARSEPNGTFTAGTFRFTTGANAGLKAIEIKSYTSDTVEVYEPFYYTPSIGDAYEMVQGCRKRLSDCQAYGNVVNFGGFLWIPAGSTYAHVGKSG